MFLFLKVRKKAWHQLWMELCSGVDLKKTSFHLPWWPLTPPTTLVSRHISWYNYRDEIIFYRNLHLKLMQIITVRIEPIRFIKTNPFIIYCLIFLINAWSFCVAKEKSQFLFFSKLFSSPFSLSLSRFHLVAHHLRVSGRMESVTDLVLKREAVGFTVANGHKDSKVVMVWGRAQHRLQNTKALGPMDFRMDTVQKHMRMEVREEKTFFTFFKLS